ncbi:MAG: NAD(P)/FAD-dependent oxidoreductase [Candidatus Nitrosopumilus limneticus]|nr:Digeranylgeranylglycerophospholipid reductase [Candidatus Nitrosopumilus limneticus]MDA0669376.1 NAD(P)/FAD-dependent oxidoreductase [Thermoproteota archaeon]HJJ21012.1 NAD(P)/FAD-dependent oxidoreductase [Nitrosopumilus sp.]MDA0853905.1 NAD(P)/FAD-dependent oxidoreductase [Thermoproteota archaeon]MDA1123311.1 NAD(P)/FAD-dependent oxidoreductase [Thermoproteota archaeon]
MYYDVVVAGGSVAGLLSAREISSNGFSVLVIEEDYEIGTPEHCGGLVSISGLEELGVIPFRKTYDHMIECAEITAPNGKKFTINSKKQKVVEISRRELDKQIAFQAQKNGAEIKVRTSFQEITDTGIRTNEGNIDCKIFVDARGVSSLIHKDRTGILSSAQYEIYADWIKKGKVEVILDQKKYPGFFAWIIPSNEGKGKVGVAGRGINAAETINEILKEKGKYSTIRKIFAPIWIKGPIEKFVDGKTVIVGDAAGQAKPTTAGGIYTSGMGGIYAGQAISKFLETNEILDLQDYQKKWTNRFGKEFEKQLLVRKILERIDNQTINKLFESITPEMTKEISEKDDFDFHTSSIIKLLGIKGSLKTAQTLISGELKKILG